MAVDVIVRPGNTTSALGDGEQCFDVGYDSAEFADRPLYGDHDVIELQEVVADGYFAWPTAGDHCVVNGQARIPETRETPSIGRDAGGCYNVDQRKCKPERRGAPMVAPEVSDNQQMSARHSQVLAAAAQTSVKSVESDQDQGSAMASLNVNAS